MPTPVEEDENRTEEGGGSGGVTPAATEQCGGSLVWGDVMRGGFLLALTNFSPCI
ncbi:hypothetical protein DVH05_024091 [Phytophthora capsici]|nr:hypothetical protein DVH05_024091 [Phytophthora capsici]